MIGANVKGLKELQRAFSELPKELSKEPLRRGALAAAEVVQEAAKARAPRGETGALSEAIFKTIAKGDGNETEAHAIVGIRYGSRFRRRGIDAWYWIYLEFGTSKMPAQPFLRPAFDSTQQAQQDAMASRLIAELKDIVAKVRW